MGLTLCGIVAAFAAQHFMLQNMFVGMRARISMIAIVYDKVTRLSVGNTSSTGQIVNIVSNDVQRLEDAATFGNFIITGICEAITVLGLVWSQVQTSRSRAPPAPPPPAPRRPKPDHR